VSFGTHTTTCTYIYTTNALIMTIEVIVEQFNLRERIHNIIDFLDGHTMQDKLDILYSCNCCERHQINKPRFFSTTFVDNISSNNNNTNNCRCNCRHRARLICRQTEDYQEGIIPINRPNSPNTVIF